MDRSKIVEQQLESYRENFLEHGDTPQGVFWNDTATMRLRYERLLRPFLPSASPLSIHDVGCGLCDMLPYLIESGIEHRYSGTEIVPEMVSAAKRKYPDIEIRQRDILAEPVDDVHDVVVLSGVFNRPGGVPREDWEPFCYELIRKMFAMARQGISFNFLTSHHTFSDPALFYLDPAEVLSFCIENLSRFVRVDHAYALFESTVTVFRSEYVRSGCRGEAFDKYFSR